MSAIRRAFSTRASTAPATGLKKASAALLFACVSVFLSVSPVTSIAGPLTTDDMDMVGENKTQFEFGAESSTFSTHRERVWKPELSVGINDSLQIVMSTPYQGIKNDDPEEGSANGFNDPSVGIKWRFFERKGLSLGLAPSVTLPLADEDKGLGNGRATYRVIGLAQYEEGDFTWLGNLGYIRNNNVAADRNNLLSVSVGAYYQMKPELKLGVDYGYNSSTDPNITRLEHFAGVGAIYSPNKTVDINLGYKRGFNSDSLDHSFVTSVTLHW